MSGHRYGELFVVDDEKEGPAYLVKVSRKRGGDPSIKFSEMEIQLIIDKYYTNILLKDSGEYNF